MAESVNGVNGHEDVAMDDIIPTPDATPGISADFSMASIDGGSTSTTRSHPEDSDDHEPPAKRARTATDSEMVSTVQVSFFVRPFSGSNVLTSWCSVSFTLPQKSASPPPASASPAPPQTPTPTPAVAFATGNGESTLNLAQWRFCLSTVKNLKKSKDGQVFLNPVDPVALDIPHYPSIIKNPMDILTIERKLNSSNPAKPDPNLNNPRYCSADEFINDVRLVFTNALTFNGPDHVVTLMGKRLGEVFDKQIKNLPPTEVVHIIFLLTLVFDLTVHVPRNSPNLPQ